MKLAPLRERLAPGPARRRTDRIIRRREKGKTPQAVQPPIDRAFDQAMKAKARKRMADGIRHHYDDPGLASRVIRMLGLPRRVVQPRKRPARKAA